MLSILLDPSFFNPSLHGYKSQCMALGRMLDLRGRGEYLDCGFLCGSGCCQQLKPLLTVSTSLPRYDMHSQVNIETEGHGMRWRKLEGNVAACDTNLAKRVWLYLGGTVVLFLCALSFLLVQTTISSGRWYLQDPVRIWVYGWCPIG